MSNPYRNRPEMERLVQDIGVTICATSATVNACLMSGRYRGMTERETLLMMVRALHGESEDRRKRFEEHMSSCGQPIVVVR